MPYVSKIWVDRQTEYPTRRKLEFDDGSSDKIVTVSREEGTIYEAGDTFDANTMNSLESRIAAGIAEKQDILIPGNGIRIDQDNVISATGGGGGIEFTKIESGSLVSVNDAADLPVVDLAVEIKAVQSGTGDPSPSNVRPIIGFTGLNLNRTGANLWNEDWEQGSIDNNGADESSTTRIRSKGYISVKGNTSYFFAWISPETTAFRLYYYDASQTFISYQQIDITTTYPNGRSFTTPVNCAYIRFRTAGTGSITTYANNISINYPSADTAYHTYTGTTVTIALGQTVYGGELDVTSGVLKITHGFDTFDGDSVTSVSEVSGAQYARVLASALSIDGTTSRMLCDSYNPVDVSANGNIRWVSRSQQVVRIFDSRFTTIENAQAILNAQPVHLCYELATPITVQLTPTEIETLLGINNIWADSGDILNLEYYTTSASDVRDFIIKDDVVSDQSSWSSDKITEELESKQDIIEAGDGIVINGNEISAVLYKELTATLNVFSTSVVFEDSSITTSSVIDIYTSKYGFNPETVTAETGRLTITFRQPEEQITVKVRIS